MALIDIACEVLKGYEFEVVPNRVFLGFSNGKKIKLKIGITVEQFFNLFSKISELLGVPVCVHSYYGFIWKTNDEYFALNTIEESYGCDVTSLFVFNKMPIGKKLNYGNYTQIEKIVEQVFSDHNLNCNQFVHYSSKRLMFKGGTIRAEQLKMLNGVLAEERAKGNYVVAGGDFNHCLIADYFTSDEEALSYFTSKQKTPDWVKNSVLHQNEIADGFKLVSSMNEATCRGADIPYERGVNYVTVIDGFIVSDNVEVIDSATVDTGYAFSDHNPVKMSFKLK